MARRTSLKGNDAPDSGEEGRASEDQPEELRLASCEIEMLDASGTPPRRQRSCCWPYNDLVTLGMVDCEVGHSL